MSKEQPFALLDRCQNRQVKNNAGNVTVNEKLSSTTEKENIKNIKN